MPIILSRENSHGKKDLEPFHTAKAKFPVYAIILKPKKSIIEKEHLQKNTLISWKNSELNMINDTFLNLLNNIMAHPYGM